MEETTVLACEMSTPDLLLYLKTVAYLSSQVSHELQLLLQRIELLQQIQLCAGLNVLRLFLVGHIVQDRAKCRLLGMNGFHVKAKNE